MTEICINMLRSEYFASCIALHQVFCCPGVSLLILILDIILVLARDEFSCARN